MSTLGNQNQEVESSIYSVNKGLILSLIFLSFASFSIGFLFNFSFEDKIIGFIEKNVKYNRKCPTSYRKLSLDYIFPKIKMFDVNLNSRCIGTSKNLKIKRLESSLGFPSISPLGLGLNTTVQDKFSKIDISSAHSPSVNHFNIESKDLDAKSLAPLLKNFDLSGNFTLNSNIAMTRKNLSDLKLKIESTNFEIPAQNVSGFDVPKLKLGSLLVKAKMKGKKKLIIEEVIVGQELSPIRASISGTIDMDKYNFSRSKLSLLATVKFSSAFIESFPILNLLLDPTKQDPQGFYKIRLKGTVSNPGKPQILNP
ncbi:MAG: hypothetical protein BM556_11155 [Bacteriovorax sp. MedPE-SWde]|nr:MAG: hypothetical protein BM556_11155 [Bacteriovorax sp. MedPE-SWde]